MKYESCQLLGKLHFDAIFLEYLACLHSDNLRVHGTFQAAFENPHAWYLEGESDC